MKSEAPETQRTISKENFYKFHFIVWGRIIIPLLQRSSKKAQNLKVEGRTEEEEEERQECHEEAKPTTI